MTKFIAFTLITIVYTQSACADYAVKIHLEQAHHGRLPDGSIVIKSPTNPVTPDPDDNTKPTDCHYSLVDSISAIAEGYYNGDQIHEAVYENVSVYNGVKGDLKFSDSGVNYYEICFNGQSPNYEKEEETWIPDDCRYQNYGNDLHYFWREVDGQGIYEGRHAFTDANVGPYGILYYQLTDITFPEGSINTNYGQIQPNNPIIGKGNHNFYRGDHVTTFNNPDGTKAYYYKVCKMTLN